MTDPQYDAAVAWLFAQAPNYQRDGQQAYKPGLDNIRRLCDFFGNPQEKIKTVHIGGTNGKGSTSSMVASVLQEAGYKTGLYTSPHLVHFTERIKINGEKCSREFVLSFVEKLRQLPPDIQPSFFEFTTVMAFAYFAQAQVDIAVIEVGLGGRLDATNILLPLVSAVTNVSLDHQNLLGETVEEIAREKAGIIKPLIPVVSGAEDVITRNILRETAFRNGSPFIDASDLNLNLTTDLQGIYQKKNIKTAAALLQQLQNAGFSISDEHLRKGFLNVQKNTDFMGRWFQFSTDPLIILDTGHNAAGLEAVFSQLKTLPQPKHIVLGFVNDKEIEPILALLPPAAQYYFTKPAGNRGRNPREYEVLLKKHGFLYKIFDDVQEAYHIARQQLKPGEMLFIGGSNFVVGEFLEKNLQK